MRLSVASAGLSAALVVTPVAAGYAPALSQDFSITNQMDPADAARRDVMRQLQAWWDVHAYYPRHASRSDEGGTVKVHLVIQTDGNIGPVTVVESSGSPSLDTAAAAAFFKGFVRPFPDGLPRADVDISLHYILLHRHDQPVAANYTPVRSKSPFTITNDPVKSPILETMLQKTCTGTVVKQGIRNHPIYGIRYWAQAIFFRKPDGTPWVKFYDAGYSILAPVTEVGNLVQWTGRDERPGRGSSLFTEYTVWPDGENKLSGNININVSYMEQSQDYSPNHGGTISFTCATEAVPAITWNSLDVTSGPSPLGDPP